MNPAPWGGAAATAASTLLIEVAPCSRAEQAIAAKSACFRAAPGLHQSAAMFRCAIVLWLATGCAADNPPVDPPQLDRDAFRCEVEPVLMARCGFYACHGTESRPLRIYAPNRLRLAPSVPQLAAPLTAEERDANYQSAAAMGELLSAKPLDADAGGQFHKGKSLYRGRDVFTATDDLGYQRIAGWLAGATADPGCEPSPEVGP